MKTPSVYRKLRRHLDSMPVGYPGTAAGTELRLLESMFTEEEAELALALDWDFRSSADIELRMREKSLDPPTGQLEAYLRRMASKGNILYRETEGTWALVPLVIGMFEFQVKRLTKEFLDNTWKYIAKGYGWEYISTGVHQTRIIPIGESVRPIHKIANYDEFRSLIAGAGERIAVLDCVCRKAMDLRGDPCRYTDRRELCMVFRDFADTVVREGWGRKIGRAEALRIAELNQEEGLVLRPSNEKEPQFLCACCGDCCGLLGLVKALPRPADYVASNFRSSVRKEACVGCGLCRNACPMEAILIEGKKASVLESRCIGCGLCVPACPREALSLAGKEKILVPPDSTEDLRAELARTKPGFPKKLALGVKAILGIRNGL